MKIVQQHAMAQFLVELHGTTIAEAKGFSEGLRGAFTNRNSTPLGDRLAIETRFEWARFQAILYFLTFLHMLNCDPCK